MAQPPNTQNLAQGAQQLLNFGAPNQVQKASAQQKQDQKMNTKWMNTYRYLFKSVNKFRAMIYTIHYLSFS